ncbi:hypothetical protein TEA_003639 [Camellia sinensis var. sinensis]|uniref:Pectin acetylesterase n=1 Tax=Camellia sinensis var. sinensis TaxID=542762 RepID=A0A4V3WMX2_CAMSN|nr:hypothetical protein TEA_003639 [Camellia sinensis var. sinensis]
MILPLQCFFPENLIANVKTPLFILNAAYDSWQASLAPASADPNGIWRDCKMNHASCSESQIQKFLQDFRNHILEGFSTSKENGLFINSCFAHCQTERQDTWFADDSPLVGNKLDLRVNHTLIKDQFLWDLNNFASDPEEFARTFCRDLGIEDPEVGIPSLKHEVLVLGGIISYVTRTLWNFEGGTRHDTGTGAGYGQDTAP